MAELLKVMHSGDGTYTNFSVKIIFNVKNTELFEIGTNEVLLQ